MAVKKVLSNIKIGGEWTEVSDAGNCYVIAVKENKVASTTVLPENVKIITFELGIDSGITNKPISISRFSINFNDYTSSDASVNAITGFMKLTNVPSTVYLRVLSVDDGQKQITSGESSISININTIG